MHEKLFENILKSNPYFNQKRELVFSYKKRFYQTRVKRTPWGSLQYVGLFPKNVLFYSFLQTFSSSDHNVTC